MLLIYTLKKEHSKILDVFSLCIIGMFTPMSPLKQTAQSDRSCVKKKKCAVILLGNLGHLLLNTCSIPQCLNFTFLHQREGDI